MKKPRLLWDIILIAGFIALALVIFLVQNSEKKAGAFAVISVNGVETERYSLHQDGSYSVNGGSNILEIKDCSAKLTDADCPDKLCVKQGKIKYTGQCITCLPNRLTVTISGGDDSVDFVM